MRHSHGSSLRRTLNFERLGRSPLTKRLPRPRRRRVEAPPTEALACDGAAPQQPRLSCGSGRFGSVRTCPAGQTFAPAVTRRAWTIVPSTNACRRSKVEFLRRCGEDTFEDTGKRLAMDVPDCAPEGWAKATLSGSVRGRLRGIAGGSPRQRRDRSTFRVKWPRPAPTWHRSAPPFRHCHCNRLGLPVPPYRRSLGGKRRWPA